MKETDLMIGDWVKTTQTNMPEAVKIIGIEVVDYSDMKYYINVDSGRYDYHLELNEIEPIKLTPEILWKNGFEKIQNLMILKCENKIYPHLIFIEYNPENFCLFINDMMLTKPIMYVHELQHVWRLCGILEEFKI